MLKQFSILNKKKIINDPVYGFIRIPHEIVYDLMAHPYFQRLRRIQQLGLTSYVYPGALHTRFHHALGAMHLMGQAIESLRYKGNEITEDEARAVCLAILLHDIGHGPFSHALEHSIVTDIHHEDLSLAFMELFNEEFDGQLSLTIEIFKNTYHKRFLHQLVSSQLDMDRLDYLTRDSFFTGVAEGVVSYDRIIHMLDVRNDELVVQAKGIYSIEKFLIARRIMYWQVYLHKTVLSAEMMLVKILQRAKLLANSGVELFATPALHHFLYHKVDQKALKENPAELLKLFASIDDVDVMASIKVWKDCDDQVLSGLCRRIVERDLLKIRIQSEPFLIEEIRYLQQMCMKKKGLTEEEAEFFVFSDSTTNYAYSERSDNINILQKNGDVLDIATASDNLNIRALTAPVTKYYLCYPAYLSQYDLVSKTPTNQA